MNYDISQLKRIVEAAIFVSEEPLSLEKISQLFLEEERPSTKEIKEILELISQDYQSRSLELKEVASGYRFQVREDLALWINRLWTERTPRFSRAFLETLALIAYRQPITRAEIEEIRGVGVNSNNIKAMLERNWIKIVGHRDVPGKPALFGTTKEFLDYFNLKSISELPKLMELQNLEANEPPLPLQLQIESVDAPQETMLENKIDSSNEAPCQEAIPTMASEILAESDNG